MGVRLEYERYEEIKEEVAQLYKELHITTFPVMCTDVCSRLGIGLHTYSEFASETQSVLLQGSGDGMVIRINNQTYILYNSSMPVERQRMTIMHEIGHIRLCHKKEDTENEAEATFFACYFYAPPVLIDYFKLKWPDDVAQKFCVSMEVAVHSLERYSKWKNYTASLTSNMPYVEYETEILSLAKEGCLQLDYPATSGGVSNPYL